MLEKLPPRERQIVDILYKRGSATVSEVGEALQAGLSASAVRAMLSRLETKGYVWRTKADSYYVYRPTLPQARAKLSALRQVVRTFFDNSPVNAATALLGMAEEIDSDELDLLEAGIARARREKAK